MTTQRHTEGFFITVVCHLYAVKTQQARAMFQVGGGCKSSVYMLGWSAASPLLHAHSMPALPFRLCVCCTTTHGHGSCTDCQPAVQNTKLLPCLSMFPKTRTSRSHQHPDSACRYACHDQHDKQHLCRQYLGTDWTGLVLSLSIHAEAHLWPKHTSLSLQYLLQVVLVLSADSSSPEMHIVILARVQPEDS